MKYYYKSLSHVTFKVINNSQLILQCFRFAQDKDLAYRINNIVEYRNNCKLLGNAFSESVYL